VTKQTTTDAYVRMTSCLIVSRSSLSRKNWFHGLYTRQKIAPVTRED